MSIFGSIMSAIFGHASSETSAAPTTPAPADSTPASPTAQPVPTSEQPAAAASRPGPPVDVAAIMDKLAQQAGQKLDWRRSIVDLMKLINLDSSLTARKELAQELNYTGNMNDTASMNIWLHKQVMIKLAENGGKVPDELKH